MNSSNAFAASTPTQPQPKQPPQLSLCMIVRDSAATLGDCLASIRPWVDEIVVVDTGSVDETPQIARRFGANVSTFPWIDDFSAARNESFSRAQGEWIFWMDSDDTMDEANGSQLSKLVRGPHNPAVMGYVVSVLCPDGPGKKDLDATVVDHVKLVRNDPRIRFEGRIHEQLLPSIRRIGGEIQWTDLVVEHSGADHSEAGKQRKRERDLRILHLDLKERPEHPFVLFNLGMTYGEMGEHAQAEEWLRRCLAVSAPDGSHVRKVYALLAASLQQQGRLEEARKACSQGLGIYPQDVELLFRQGMIAQELGRSQDAIRAYQQALTSSEERHFVSVDRSLAGYKTRNNLALIYEDLGELGLAEIQWRAIVESQQHFQPAWRGLGQLLIRQRKFTALEILLEQLKRHSWSRPDILWLEALTAESQVQLEAALPLLEQALQADNQHLNALRDYCRILFRLGRIQEAAAALEKLTRRSPTDAAAFHNLGLAYSQLGLHQQAAVALERSLQLRPNSECTHAELEQLQSLSLAANSQNGPGSEATCRCRPSTPEAVPLDVLFLFCHSRHQDQELKYSLRSIAQHAPYVRKVWIFGDRPEFLSDDRFLVEHVDQALLAEPLGFRLPVRNEFLMLFLASLIPELSSQFMKFADDYVLLQDIPKERLYVMRALEDINQIPVRGRGPYKDLVWLTYDVLKRAGYPGYSFESHVPQPYTRRLVLNAFRTFRDYISQERMFGLLSATAVCNYAVKELGTPVVWLEEEQSKQGYYRVSPTREQLEAECANRIFLSFDDAAVGEPLLAYLQSRFPQPCKYEKQFDKNSDLSTVTHQLIQWPTTSRPAAREACHVVL